MMTAGQALVTIGICALGTMLTRFLPFILFPENKKRRNLSGISERFSPVRSSDFLLSIV